MIEGESEDEVKAHAGALALLDEARDAVAERVDLQDEADLHLLHFAQLDEAVLNRLRARLEV